MSEEILKALMQLFGIVTKQGDIITEEQRDYVKTFLIQQIGPEQVPEYLLLFDKESGYDKQQEEGFVAKRRKTSVGDSVRTLAACKKINKTLEQKQKIIVFIRLLELIHADKNDSSQAMEIVDTVATVFKIEGEEYKDIKNFVSNTELEGFDSEQYLIADGVNREEDKNKRKRKVKRNEVKLEIKAKFLYIENMVGKVVFLKVPSAELYFTKVIDNKNLFMAGLPIVENTINIFPHGSTIKLPTGKPIYYSEIVARYIKDSIDVNISFNATNIEYVFPNGRKGLRGVNISEETGKLVGIMGASGAGKSTLLNVLNGNDAPTGGKVLINGIDIHHEKDKVEGVIGYVPQDDLLIDELTVYENLYYNGKLCLNNLSDEELHDEIMKLLRNLDLMHTKDLKVGNPLQKTISGGQRKRLNIGLELIREPSVMFVDEPTSGLSSRDSENIMDLLKELALKGKIIFVVIHQPSSDIYKMFDKMFILDTGGFPIYYGDPVEAIHYFKDKANQVGSASGECNVCGNVNPELIFNIIDAKLVDDYGRHLDGRKVSPKQWNRYYLDEFNIPKVEDAKEEPPSTLFIPNKLGQWLTFIKRDVLSKLKNAQYMWINSLEAPVLAFVLAAIVKHAGDFEEYKFFNNANIPAYIFMSIVVALFMGLTVSAEEIIKDQRILKREKFLNLSKFSYLMSKVAILTSISAIQTFCFVLVGNFMLDIDGMFFQYWFVLFSTAVFSNILGLNISASFNSAVTIYILIPLIIIPQMILSGAMFSFDKINKAIGGGNNKVPTLSEFMVSRWAFEALAVEQFMNNDFEKQFYYYHKVESQLNYKLAYLFPEIREKISDCIKLQDELGDEANTKYEKYLEAIRNAFEKENEELPVEYQFLKTSMISPKDFDGTVAQDLKYTLEDWTDYYSKPFVKVSDYLDGRRMELESIAGDENYTYQKETYSNESLTQLMKNEASLEKVKIINGEFEQVSDPIFRTPETSLLGFNSHFYAPMKPLFGGIIFTYWYNMIIIWGMSILAFVSVYNDWLKRSLDYFSGIDFSGIKIPILSNIYESIERLVKKMVIKRKKKKRDRAKAIESNRKKVEGQESSKQESGKKETGLGGLFKGRKRKKLKAVGETADGEEIKFKFDRPKTIKKGQSTAKYQPKVRGEVPGGGVQEERAKPKAETFIPELKSTPQTQPQTQNEKSLESGELSEEEKEKAERKRLREEKKRLRQEARAEREMAAASDEKKEGSEEEVNIEVSEKEDVVEEVKVEEFKEKLETKKEEEVKAAEEIAEDIKELEEEKVTKTTEPESTTVSKTEPAPQVEGDAPKVPNYGQNMTEEERAEKERKREERRRKRKERLNKKFGG